MNTAAIIEAMAAQAFPEAKAAWDELIEWGTGEMGWTPEEALAYADQAHKSHRPEVNWHLARKRAQAALSTAWPMVREADPRIAAVREVIERGGFRFVNGKPFYGEFEHGEKCDHDRFGYEDCIGCYDEALLAALDTRADL